MARNKRPLKIPSAKKHVEAPVVETPVVETPVVEAPVVETPPDDTLNEQAAVAKDVGLSFIEESFREFCASPAGLDAMDTRLPRDHARLYGELEDRLRVAFLAGLNLEG